MAPTILKSIAVVLQLITLAHSYVVKPRLRAFNNSTSIAEAHGFPELLKRAGDPTSFAWVHRLAAIGDSFTAGIGSGNQLGEVFHDRDSWFCSRYDMSYPMLVNSLIGPSVDEFQFPACSGDRSVQIYDQVDKLKNDQNLVIMTAGGNDLCLAGMIKKCVMLPYGGEATCDAVIDKAEENIGTILKPNLKQILTHLDGKMAKDGVVVYNGYAQFFDTENESCANNQQWNMGRWLPKYWFSTPLKLTIARRKRFNDLVIKINQAIRDVIKDVSDEVGYTIGFSNWDPWAIDGVDGQMCAPVSTGYYPDSKQPDLQFFKPDTHVTQWTHDELKKREAEIRAMYPDGLPEPESDQSIYDTLLWKTPDPRAEARRKLDKRAPSPPGCPGDSDWFDPTLGLGLPDSFGKLFHPNELGHKTIASFAIAEAIDLRAKVLGLESETCELTDEFKCWQKQGRKGYATADRMNENYKDFCNDVKQPANTVGWKWEKTYHPGTPDEHTFLLQLGQDTADFVKDACLESYERIINGCDGGDPENPMNWKFGGSWRRDQYTYEISVKRDNRPWPMIKSPYGSCKGNWKALWSHYELYGAGFASWDHGQPSILDKIKGCLGLGVTKWEFTYFDSPNEDGMEWHMKFNTPVFVNARCFKNNKVVQGAGGFTNGCGGSDA